MNDIFLNIFNMSISASYLVFAVITFRFLLKKAPKKLNCFLWLLVAVRLLCPFSIESVLSLIPEAQTVPTEMPLPALPRIPTVNTPNDAVNAVINQAASESVKIVNTAPVISVVAIIWLCGIAAMLLYAFISAVLIKRKVAASVVSDFDKHVFFCDYIDTPFIFGIVNPKIYFPSCISRDEIPFVLRHEKAHLKRLDHIIKPLGFLILAVYWFNPILWLAYSLLCRDIELACDEKAITEMSVGEKRSYTEALLNCSVPKKMMAACPLAFGETGVKARIKNVLNYKKPTFWIIAVAVVACATISICFLTDPKGTTLNYVSHTIRPDYIEVITPDNSYKITNEAAIYYTVDFWQNLPVKSKPLDSSRSETRDKTNSVIFHYSDIDAYDVSYHLNTDCSKIWGTDSTTVSYTMATKNRAELLEFFGLDIEKLGENSSFRTNTELFKLCNKQYKIQQYYFEDMIGVDRANSEMKPEFRCHISSDRSYWESYNESPRGRGRLEKYADDIDGYISLIRETLPTLYKSAEIKSAYYTVEDNNSYHFIILMKGGDILGATVADHTKTGENLKYVMASYKLKEDGNLIEYLTESDSQNDTIVYKYKNKNEPLDLTLTLNKKDSSFHFLYSCLSSYYAIGKYERTAERLMLRTDDGLYTYVFDIEDENTVRFNEKLSSELPKYRYSADSTEAESPVPDGAIFTIR